MDAWCTVECVILEGETDAALRTKRVDGAHTYLNSTSSTLQYSIFCTNVVTGYLLDILACCGVCGGHRIHLLDLGGC